MKRFIKALPEILAALVIAGLYICVCIMAARSAAADDGSKAASPSQQNEPAPTAQRRGESQGYLVTITDSGQYPDPEFRRLVEMEACRYFLGQERCERIIGVGHPHPDGFWEWTEVRQCVYKNQRVLGCRTFRPIQEKCIIEEVEPQFGVKIKRRCAIEEEVDLIGLTVQLGDACEDVLQKKKEPPPQHPGLLP